jgi:hypothetical protein
LTKPLELLCTKGLLTADRSGTAIPLFLSRKHEQKQPFCLHYFCKGSVPRAAPWVIRRPGFPHGWR